jgi:hypothetical protein
MISAWDPLLRQLAPRSVVHSISDFLAGSPGRINQKVLLHTGLPHKMLHHIFRHGAAADIAVANKQYFYHRLMSPYKSCISFQMPNIVAVFGIFMLLCFQDIFSTLPVFSHAFSCNIGK